MNGDQIRQSFIQFYQSKGHLHLPSASLIPAGDPTLLFTSAGMVPFKPYFMGEQTPPRRRLTTHQKSFRTTDIDEVGDHKHLTFFEMLGNFSIGDYFKNDAISFAWELVTTVFKLAPERLFITVHLDDDEAYHLWNEMIGVPPERIYRYGDKENWWGPAGSEGPTGPCSELHYDFGADKGCGALVTPDQLTELLRAERATGQRPPIPGCHPNCDCERFVELWNLVFMQYYQDPQRHRTPLPAPSVDTGMGLERAAAILQEKSNVYETDLFQPILRKVCDISGKTYGRGHDTDFALRVVAEHSRAASFLIGDGVVPGNDGRGYVLRRIIRRAVRHGRRLGLTQPFLTEVAQVTLDKFGPTYQELRDNGAFILRVIRLEEERFQQAIETGLPLLQDTIIPLHKGFADLIGKPDAAQRLARLRQEHRETYGHPALLESLVNELQASLGAPNEPQAQQLGRMLSGHEVFYLYDTIGFPSELTAEIARENGLEIDLPSFEREMEAQRERARSAHAFTGGMEMLTAYENLGAEKSAFVGYQELQRQAVIVALLMDNQSVGRVAQGQQCEIVLDATPFYPEGGGQVGDQGTLIGPNGVVRVQDTQSPVAGLIVHKCVVTEGDLALGEEVKAQVELTRRLDAARNHSGTHLLHAALRSVLGPHVRQAGSYCGVERLRFDFSHVSPLSRQELLAAQSLANEKIRENLNVTTHEASYAEAVREGALAFFGDRYGETVRVVSMSDDGQPFSLEVCGGTHVHATGQVGTLLALGEASVGGGMRRIEAVTGRAAEQLFVEQAAKLEGLARRLQTPVADLEARLDSFMQDTEQLKRRLAQLERANLRAEAEALLSRTQDVNGVKVVAGRTSAASADAMREMGDFIKAKLSSVALVLGAVVNGAPLLVTMATPDLVQRGVHAGNLARDTARALGGGGGGRPDLAQAGGKDASKLDEALRGVAERVRQSLKS